ncbi:MAG: Ig-like domain-containing protein, partial [Anaerolineales bacterium]|nr:Ig-like domain-containing protein [Anaerolineales bacterium]
MDTLPFPKVVCVCLGLLFLSACASSTATPQVWIDVPIDGLKSPPGASIQVEGHAAAPGGVARVEVWVDGQLLQTIASPLAEGPVARYAVDWRAPEAGTHTIEAIAFSADGAASIPDQARVIVAAVPPTDTPTPVATPTFTPSPTPPTGIEFWADPAKIVAGACTDLRWRVLNATSVRVGGTNVDPEGKYNTCLCSNETYTLTVVLPDGTEEERRVDIEVEGECKTPTPA